MSQDLRKMFTDLDQSGEYIMKAGHEKRFLERLEKELPSAKRSVFPWVKIAAALVLLMGLGTYFLLNVQQNGTLNTRVVDSEKVLPVGSAISLGDLSPDLKKLENYYMANINMELSHLEISDRNKILIDSFMERMEELNNEYKVLNGELNEIGPNDQTISALIKNLQLRLQLLRKLKDKLIELKAQNSGSDNDNAMTSI
ncbi:hypothetical protein KCTC52924_02488 [Arenibacter antarcticus]|uniref:Uncharacterized protein n=1 Tax=Arenibacter antarcticus TaxID=2040469 RepID=A0ABW5VJB4_9FLAO|nr:hypothetical protein [Arenibacter sp. H213]MCM4168795.1 hypothetical protein [Arenibacter sp. H213]